MRTALPYLLVALLGLTVAGCAVPKHMRSARDYHAAGADYRAANEYLFVLDRRPSHGDAAFGLMATAEPGYRKRLSQAQAKEASGDYRRAAEIYDELARYVHRLEVHGMLDFETPDFTVRADEMREAAVAADFKAGEVALQRGDFGVAFAKFTSVQGERPDWPGLQLALAKTWYGSARDNEVDHQYRTAVEQYIGAEEAYGRPYEDARDRAGMLMTALGRYHLQRGSCRQAWRDLKIADRLTTTDLVSEVQDAWDCAVSHVVVEPTQMRFGSDITGVDVAGLLQQGVVDVVANEMSEFIGLLDPQQRGLSDFTYQVTLTEAWAETTSAQTRKTTTGLRQFACSQTDEFGEAIPATCEERVEVLYEQVDIESVAQLVGRADLQHRRTRVRSRHELGHREESRTTFAHDFRDANGPIVVGSDPETTVVVDDSILALHDAPHQPMSERELALRAINVLAQEAGSFLLRAVDTEPDVTDPTDLAL